LDNLQLEPPKKLQETFDIVHLRLWLGGVPNGDPTALLTHALKLLRKGLFIDDLNDQTTDDHRPRRIYSME
jgi:hypothetical protein